MSTADEELAARLKEHAEYLDREGAAGTFSKDLTAAARRLERKGASEAELMEAILSCWPLITSGLSKSDFAAAAACRIRHDFDVRQKATSASLQNHREVKP